MRYIRAYGRPTGGVISLSCIKTNYSVQSLNEISDKPCIVVCLTLICLLGGGGIHSYPGGFNVIFPIIFKII